MDSLCKSNKREIGLIAARSENNVIGKGGRIPWDIEGELSQFKELTMGNTVVEDGDAFFPEFDAEDFELTTGETYGDEIKYTRTVYRRKKNV